MQGIETGGAGARQQNIQSDEVAWDLEGITVYGTLTRPEGTGPWPGIVFVAGSGPTDRDWCSPLIPGTNCSGRLLAEALTRAGFMTLRYDKRASGSHVMENLPRLLGRISMQSHVDELKGAVDLLVSDPDVDPSRLFVLTSSEGAIHALNYQVRSPDRRFAALILTGAPGRSISQVARSQVEAQLENLPDRELLTAHYTAATAAFERGEPVVPDPALPEGVRMLLISLSSPANLPFTRELWSADPTALVAKVSEPILVVIGKKDIQIDWQADGRPLEEATADRGNGTFEYPADADHVLKYEDCPRDELVAAEVAARYNDEGRILDPEAVAAILRWLKER
jgi:uncharacterized protein